MARHLRINFPSVGVVHVEIIKERDSKGRSDPLWDEIRARFDAFNEDQKVKVILLSGDLSDETNDEFAKQPSARFAFEGAIEAVEHCTKAVICLLTSACSSPGFVLTSACDIRVAASGITIDIKSVASLGSVGLRTLKRLYWTAGNSSWTNTCVLAAQPFNAVDALKNRVISRVWEDKDQATCGSIELAIQISLRSLEGIQYAKKLWVGFRNALDEKIPMREDFYSEEEANRDLDQALGVGLLGVRALL